MPRLGADFITRAATVREALALEARALVEEHFDWVRIAAKVKQALQERPLILSAGSSG